MIFSQSRVYVAMQECILMVRIEAQKSIDMFEESENNRVFLDHKVPKKMFFIQSRLYMVMQGCILMLRVGVQKSMDIFEELENSPIF